MQRIFEKLSGIAVLHDVSRVHDVNTVHQLSDHAQRVSDHDQRALFLLHQPAQKLVDLPLNRDVQRGTGLIRDQQLTGRQKRCGNADSLPHTA